MRKERKHFTAEEKVAILRRHLVDKVPKFILRAFRVARTSCPKSSASFIEFSETDDSGCIEHLKRSERYLFC
jgi:hypothetical protein